jgi:hypothetical protein
MFINTQAQELQSFDPTKSGQFELPPLGIYNEQFKVVSMQEGQTKNNEGKLDVVFEMLTGPVAGFHFSMAYNVGHSKPDTAKWAIQDLMRIGYGTTGNKNYGRDGAGFNTSELIGKTLAATLTVADSKNQKDDGSFFPQARFTKIAPIADPSQETQAGGYNQNQNNNNQNNNQNNGQQQTTTWGPQQ